MNKCNKMFYEINSNKDQVNIKLPSLSLKSKEYFSIYKSKSAREIFEDKKDYYKKLNQFNNQYSNFNIKESQTAHNNKRNIQKSNSEKMKTIHVNIKCLK